MSIKFETALSVFADAFALVRSATFPAESLRCGPLWIVRDRPRPIEQMRIEEIFAYGCSPLEAVAAVRTYAPRSRYTLGLFETPKHKAHEIKSIVRQHGYRSWFNEPLFVCDIRGAPELCTRKDIAGCTLHRAQTPEEIAAVTRAVGGKSRRMADARQLAGRRPQVRMYYASVDGAPVAHGRSIHLRPAVSWVHDVATHPAHRRRGIATALMAYMLADDAAHGAKHSVLLASHTGALLYPRLGYQQIGTLLMFIPSRRKSSPPAPRQ